MPSDLDPKPSDSPPKESSHAPFGERIPERQVRRGAFPPARERSVLGHSLPPESDIFMISGISFPDRSQGSGAWGRIRTTDTRIFNPLLYQLSYPGALRDVPSPGVTRVLRMLEGGVQSQKADFFTASRRRLREPHQEARRGSGIPRATSAPGRHPHSASNRRACRMGHLPCRRSDIRQSCARPHRQTRQ